MLHHYDEYVSVSSIPPSGFFFSVSCRGPVHHLLFIRRPPRNHVRRIRYLTLSNPLNVPTWTTGALNLLMTTLITSLATPWTWPPSFYPSPMRLSLAIMVPISESPLLLNCDPIHPSFQSCLGLELFSFYCFHRHGFHGVLPLGSIGPVFSHTHSCTSFRLQLQSFLHPS